MKAPLFEKDILYRAGTKTELGSIHVSIYPPEKSGSIPLIVEQNSDHDPLKYIEDIIELIQSDKFDRLKIEIKSQSIIYFKKKQEAGYYSLKFDNDGRSFTEKSETINL